MPKHCYVQPECTLIDLNGAMQSGGQRTWYDEYDSVRLNKPEEKT